MGEKQIMHVFIKASVSEIKNTFSFCSWQVQEASERQMGVYKSPGFRSFFFFKCAVIDIPLKPRLLNIDLSSLLLHSQMVDGQLAFDNT